MPSAVASGIWRVRRGRLPDMGIRIHYIVRIFSYLFLIRVCNDESSCSVEICGALIITFGSSLGTQKLGSLVLSLAKHRR
jgi:hypothetical protein